jgi:hypothetical protein
MSGITRSTWRLRTGGLPAADIRTSACGPPHLIVDRVFLSTAADAPSRGTFHCVVRCSGVRHSRINVEIEDPRGLPAFIFNMGGIDSLNAQAGSQYNDPGELLIDARASGLGFVAKIGSPNGRIVFAPTCRYIRDLSRTDEMPAFEFHGGDRHPPKQSSVIISGTYAGFTCLAKGEPQNTKHVKFKGGELQWNSRTEAPAVYTSVIPDQ